jgi:hypothetical protein
VTGLREHRYVISRPLSDTLIWTKRFNYCKYTSIIHKTMTASSTSHLDVPCTDDGGYRLQSNQQNWSATRTIRQPLYLVNKCSWQSTQ